MHKEINALSTWLHDNRRWLETEDVMNVVCLVYNITPGELSNNRRHRHLVDARRAYVWCVLHMPFQTLHAVGKTLGKDHTTIIFHRTGAAKLIDAGDDVFLICLGKVLDNLKTLHGEKVQRETAA